MRENTALRTMKAGKPVYGLALGYGSAFVAESVASVPLDFVMVDTQHGSYYGESAALSLMATSHGVPVPMARAARNDYLSIARLIDEGAMGIIIPLVNTPEEAKAAADACRFPPVGNRSWGWGRASALGDDYTARINDELFVCIQLESVEAVKNAEAIMATPGIDGCWVGPGDMSLSYGGHPRDIGDIDAMEKGLEAVVKACRNTGTFPGFAAWSADEAKWRASQGFQFLTCGSDTGLLTDGAMATARALGKLDD